MQNITYINNRAARLRMVVAGLCTIDKCTICLLFFFVFFAAPTFNHRVKYYNISSSSTWNTYCIINMIYCIDGPCSGRARRVADRYILYIYTIHIIIRIKLRLQSVCAFYADVNARLLHHGFGCVTWRNPRVKDLWIARARVLSLPTRASYVYNKYAHTHARRHPVADFARTWPLRRLRI